MARKPETETEKPAAQTPEPRAAAKPAKEKAIRIIGVDASTGKAVTEEVEEE
jgi:hypothetical protein